MYDCVCTIYVKETISELTGLSDEGDIIHTCMSFLSTDEEDSGVDDGDVTNRVTLKHQSQSIIDANTRRKTRIKKRKGQL